VSTLSLVLLSLAFAADPVAGVPRADNPDATPAALPATGQVGRIEVEALLPTEIVVDGVKLGQLWIPGEAAFTIPTGEHLLRAYTQGKPHDLPIRVTATQPVHVLVGRSGISADRPTEADDAAVAVQVEFRVMGARGAVLRLDDGKHQVQPGQPLSIELEPGLHPLSVRSSNGTVIWASGMLSVSGTQPVVVHVTEGRMPEVSGGGQFHSGSEG
jgi:hypothetical protein